jgi:hypothetical protein
MNTVRLAIAALCVTVAAPVAAQSPVSIQFQDGNVTIRATNVPLRTVLAEWARVGGSRIVNHERVTGNVDVLALDNVPEREALRQLLRSISGYIVGARTDTVAGRSTFDRIFLLPTSTVGRAPAPPQIQAAAPPPAVVYLPGDPDDAANQGAAGARAQQLIREVREMSDAQRRLAEAAATAAAAREAEEEEDEDGAPARPAPGARTPGPAGGVIRGSSRPGEITPVPSQPNNQRR